MVCAGCIAVAVGAPYCLDQCLIFCRTNFDCDNLETFLTSLGVVVRIEPGLKPLGMSARNYQ